MTINAWARYRSASRLSAALIIPGLPWTPELPAPAETVLEPYIGSYGEAPVAGSPRSAAAVVLERIPEAADIVLGITGPSGVGKSHLADDLRSELALQSAVACVFCVDQCLRPELRGDTTYSASSRRVIMPSDYDWSVLGAVLRSAEVNRPIELDGYERGHGWRRSSIDASFPLLVDGLFLDSEDARPVFRPSLLVALHADRSVVADWRRERDARVRAVVDGWRTERETEAEIRRWQLSEDAYRRAPVGSPCMRVVLDGDHNVSSVDWRPDGWT